MRLHTGRSTARRAALVVTAAAEADSQGPSAYIAERCVCGRFDICRRVHITSHSSATFVYRFLNNPERVHASHALAIK